MNQKIIVPFVIVVAVLFGVFMIFKNEKGEEASYSGPMETLKVGIVKEYSALVLVAKDRGFFEKNGLNVVTTEYSSGASSFKGFLEGEVEITTAADFVGVSHSFNNDFKILTSMTESADAFELVGRRDRGIGNPADLKGKTIGVTKKAMGEFFLGSFLTFNNIDLKDAKYVDGDPASLSQKIQEGSIDAVITFNPHIYNIRRQLGENAATFFVQGNQWLYTLLFTKDSVIESKGPALKRFLKALGEAEDFMAANPQWFEKFVTAQFGYSGDYVSLMLVQSRYRLSLNQSLITAFEDEARWMIDHKLTDRTEVPNYLKYIYFDALAAVRPESINIVR